MNSAALACTAPMSRPSASAACPSAASSARRPRPKACAPSTPPGTPGSPSSTPPTCYGKGISRNRHRQVAAQPPATAPTSPPRPPSPTTPPAAIDNRPEHLRAELEGSLKRLGVDHVTLFYAHRHDPADPGRGSGRHHATPCRGRENPGLRPVGNRAPTRWNAAMPSTRSWRCRTNTRSGPASPSLA